MKEKIIKKLDKITKKEVNSEVIQMLKKEHNKTAKWIDFFNKRIDVLEGKVKRLKEEADSTREKEMILAKSILRVVDDAKKLNKKK